MKQGERQYEAIKFTFGPDDIQELGQKLARETQNVYDLRDRKKEMDADISAQIKAAEGRVSGITVALNNGYEMRELEVLTLFDTPKVGYKRTIRADNNEHLRDEAMTLEEKQGGFGFEGE